MSENRIDLHTHTTASDGSLTPGQLVEAAVAAGLRAVAITDHDTADGVSEAVETGRELDIRVVPGIEISAQMPGGTLHILGYEIDPEESRFAEAMIRLQQSRAERNPKIISKLQESGISITMEMVEARAGGGLVGRPHIAETLVELSAVGTTQEAFDLYLASDARAYVHKFRFDPETAFELIRGAGGIPVMAHPYQTNREGEELHDLVGELKAQGLEGIEIYYSYHTPEQTDFYHGLALEFDLVPTGGTDYHGSTKPDINLGSGRGDMSIPADLLDGLDRRVADLRARLT